MIYPALYAAVVGSSMIATWVALYRRQGIPELATEPIRIRGGGLISDKENKCLHFF